MHNVQVRIKRLGKGVPTPDDFELIETPAPTVSAGQILCRARWLALDPHARAPLNGHEFPGRSGSGDVLPSRAVADVIESRNDVFAVGACVELEHGLQKLRVSDGSRVHAVRPGQNPPSTALGILGVPGMTAYLGLLEAGRLQPRETVLVSAAAGAVGAMVGQIAMLHGARAIGIASGKEKCDWVTKSARFSACIDQRSENVSARLRALAPSGVDIFFDDTGGEIQDTIVNGRHLAANGRIVECAEIQPRIVADYAHRRDEYLKHAIAWYGEGLLVYREDVVEGLHNAAAHFCKLMRGENFGKALVRLPSACGTHLRGSQCEPR